MKVLSYFIGLTTMLSVAFSPAFAHEAKCHSSSFNPKKCCKKTLKLLKEINNTTQQDLTIDEEILDIVSCGAPVQITQDMVTAGLTITEPGVYQFCENITFSPCVVTAATAAKSASNVDVDKLKADITQLAQTKKGSISVSDIQNAVNANTAKNAAAMTASAPTAAITIASSNVYIDMKNFTLQQGDSCPGVVGYWLTEGFENISIVNGTIQYFLGAGIASFIDTAEDPADQLYLKQLLFNNLTIVDNGGLGDPSSGARIATGISLETDLSGAQSPNYDTPQFYQNVQVLNCNVNRNTGGGVQVTQASDVTVENTHIDYTYLGSEPLGFYLALYGFGALSCENVRIINSTCNETTFQGTTADTFIVFQAGAFMIPVQNIYIDRCQFNNTRGSAIIVSGIVSGTIDHAFVQNSQFNNATGIGSACLLIEGWHMSDSDFAQVSGDGYRIVNCQFNNSYSEQGNLGYLQVSGNDFITCKDIVLENCQAMGSTLVGDFPFLAETFGFHIGTSPSNGVSNEQSSTRNITFRNVTVGDITGPQDVIGIMTNSSSAEPIVGFATNYTIEGAIIGHIRTSHATQPAFGIGATCPSDAFYQNLYISNNRISDVYSTDATNTSSAGIGVLNVIRPNISNNSISDCENGIVLDSGSTDGVVVGNEVDWCPNAGIWDTLPTTTTFYSQNKVINCGTPSTCCTNYQINWGIKPPVINASLSKGYPKCSNPWFNLSVTP
jgi:hypothetical protein